MGKERVDELRAWFDEHGWQLDPPALRAALEERGAAVDVIVDLIDEGADRRRAATPEPQPEPAAAPAGSNGRRRRSEQQLAPIPDRTLVPPQNLEAEEHVIGAMMLSPGACRAVREILADDGREFYRDSHARIYRAALQLLDRGVDVNAITLTDQLDKTGDLDEIGGRVRLHELAALVPATVNAPHYARIVVETSALREIIKAGGEIARLGWERPGDSGELLEQARDIIGRVQAPTNAAPPPEAVAGGVFVFDEPVDIDSIRLWGKDAAIGWAGGEALMIVGPDGVGKTTLLQQLMLARAGLRQEVLGMHVAPTASRVLYIAADRPRQAARSIRRMVVDSERGLLDERVTFWRGPLPQLLNEDRTILTRLAKQFDCDTVAIDSLKDVAVDLSKDESGGRVATAFQHAIANGIEIVCAHHPRKPGVEQVRKPRELADVYGSRLIFGVFGSVIMLWGDPGDVLVELSHLKQPIDEIGPWNILHDHRRGHTTVEHGADLIDIVLAAGTAGVTAKSAAEVVYETETPTKQQVHRIRGRLDRLADADKVTKLPSTRVGGEVRFFYNGPAEVLTR